MRKTIAAACAAILVGLAQPSALCAKACASLWMGTACESVSAASLSQHASRVRAAGSRCQALIALPQIAVHAAKASARVLLSARVWRAPSGPAPSQAPPALV